MVVMLAVSTETSAADDVDQSKWFRLGMQNGDRRRRSDIIKSQSMDLYPTWLWALDKVHIGFIRV